jgi:hypothetical protein
MSQAARSPASGLALIESPEIGARGVLRHQRRLEPLHPPAFLIDQHRRVGPADAVAQTVGQRRTCSRLSMLRANRINPQGLVSCKKGCFISR